MRSRGFTLIELMVVVLLVLALWSALILLSERGSFLRGRAIASMYNGKMIHNAIFASNVVASTPDPRESLFAEIDWPKYGPTRVGDSQFQTSTDFFIHMVTGDVFNVATFGFFAPLGVTRAKGGYETFHAANNGWCVVGNVDGSYPEAAPFLFTRNLANFYNMATPIPEKRGWVSPSVMPEDENAPFHGRDAFVFITKGGAGFMLLDRQLKYCAFTNVFLQVNINGASLTNPILRP